MTDSRIRIQYGSGEGKRILEVCPDCGWQLHDPSACAHCNWIKHFDTTRLFVRIFKDGKLDASAKVFFSYSGEKYSRESLRAVSSRIGKGKVFVGFVQPRSGRLAVMVPKTKKALPQLRLPKLTQRDAVVRLDVDEKWKLQKATLREEGQGTQELYDLEKQPAVDEAMFFVNILQEGKEIDNASAALMLYRTYPKGKRKAIDTVRLPYLVTTQPPSMGYQSLAPREEGELHIGPKDHVALSPIPLPKPETDSMRVTVLVDKDWNVLQVLINGKDKSGFEPRVSQLAAFPKPHTHFNLVVNLLIEGQNTLTAQRVALQIPGSTPYELKPSYYATENGERYQAKNILVDEYNLIIETPEGRRLPSIPLSKPMRGFVMVTVRMNKRWGYEQIVYAEEGETPVEIPVSSLELSQLWLAVRGPDKENYTPAEWTAQVGLKSLPFDPKPVFVHGERGVTFYAATLPAGLHVFDFDVARTKSDGAAHSKFTAHLEAGKITTVEVDLAKNNGVRYTHFGSVLGPFDDRGHAIPVLRRYRYVNTPIAPELTQQTYQRFEGPFACSNCNTPIHLSSTQCFVCGAVIEEHAHVIRGFVVRLTNKYPRALKKEELDSFFKKFKVTINEQPVTGLWKRSKAGLNKAGALGYKKSSSFHFKLDTPTDPLGEIKVTCTKHTLAPEGLHFSQEIARMHEHEFYDPFDFEITLAKDSINIYHDRNPIGGWGVPLEAEVEKPKFEVQKHLPIRFTVDVLQKTTGIEQERKRVPASATLVHEETGEAFSLTKAMGENGVFYFTSGLAAGSYLLLLDSLGNSSFSIKLSKFEKDPVAVHVYVNEKWELEWIRFRTNKNVWAQSLADQVLVKTSAKEIIAKAKQVTIDDGLGEVWFAVQDQNSQARTSEEFSIFLDDVRVRVSETPVFNLTQGDPGLTSLFAARDGFAMYHPASYYKIRVQPGTHTAKIAPIMQIQKTIFPATITFNVVRGKIVIIQLFEEQDAGNVFFQEGSVLGPFKNLARAAGGLRSFDRWTPDAINHYTQQTYKQGQALQCAACANRISSFTTQCFLCGTQTKDRAPLIRKVSLLIQNNSSQTFSKDTLEVMLAHAQIVQRSATVAVKSYTLSGDSLAPGGAVHATFNFTGLLELQNPVTISLKPPRLNRTISWNTTLTFTENDKFKTPACLADFTLVLEDNLASVYAGIPIRTEDNRLVYPFSPEKSITSGKHRLVKRKKEPIEPIVSEEESVTVEAEVANIDSDAGTYVESSEPVQDLVADSSAVSVAPTHGVIVLRITNTSGQSLIDRKVTFTHARTSAQSRQEASTKLGVVDDYYTATLDLEKTIAGTLRVSGIGEFKIVVLRGKKTVMGLYLSTDDTVLRAGYTLDGGSKWFEAKAPKYRYPGPRQLFVRISQAGVDTLKPRVTYSYVRGAEMTPLFDMTRKNVHYELTLPLDKDTYGRVRVEDVGAFQIPVSITGGTLVGIKLNETGDLLKAVYSTDNGLNWVSVNALPVLKARKVLKKDAAEPTKAKKVPRKRPVETTSPEEAVPDKASLALKPRQLAVRISDTGGGAVLDHAVAFHYGKMKDDKFQFTNSLVVKGAYYRTKVRNRKDGKLHMGVLSISDLGEFKIPIVPSKGTLVAILITPDNHILNIKYKVGNMQWKIPEGAKHSDLDILNEEINALADQVDEIYQLCPSCFNNVAKDDVNCPTCGHHII